MAKITVNVDTESKTLEVSINGEIQQNVQEANFYIYDDSYENRRELSSRITLFEKNKDTGITSVTYLMAKASEEGREALSAGAKSNEKYKDLVETTSSDKVKNDILQYFSRP